MQKKTHIAFGIFLGAILYYFGLPIKYIFLIGVTAFLPDIDWYMDKVWFKQGSIVKEIWYRIAKGRGMHRTTLHNLWVLIPLSIVLGYFSSWDLYTVTVGILGYVSHLLIDSLTKTGIYWLWPYGDEKIFGEKKLFLRGSFVTGGFGEAVLQSILILSAIAVFVALAIDWDYIIQHTSTILNHLI